MGSDRESGSVAVGIILILCGAARVWVEVFEEHAVPNRWSTVERHRNIGSFGLDLPTRHFRILRLRSLSGGMPG